jgi:hypothetical protein
MVQAGAHTRCKFTLARHGHPDAGGPCVQVALNKVHGEGYCGAHRLPVGKTAAERIGTRTSCRSGSEIIRRSTTSAIHGTGSLFEVPNIVEIPIPVASKKMVKSETASPPVLSTNVPCRPASGHSRIFPE